MTDQKFYNLVIPMLEWDENTKDDIVEQLVEHCVKNSGERLINFSEKERFKTPNVYYRPKKIHKFTWVQPTR